MQWNVYIIRTFLFNLYFDSDGDVKFNSIDQLSCSNVYLFIILNKFVISFLAPFFVCSLMYSFIIFFPHPDIEEKDI